MGEPKLLHLATGVELPRQDEGTIGVGDSIASDEVVRLVLHSGLRHVVQKDGWHFETELAAAQKMCRNPSQFLDNPLETIFGTDEVETDRGFFVEVGADEKKSKTLSEFEAFVESLTGSATVRDQAMMIADELYTNAAKNGWDPPRLTKDSNYIRPGRVTFFARGTEDRLVFGCRDTYGTLAFEQVLERIELCIRDGVAQSIRQGNGGAGIGSYKVFTSCISYYAGVEKGKRTAVCVALPLGMSQRAASRSPKNIHLVSF